MPKYSSTCANLRHNIKGVNNYVDMNIYNNKRNCYKKNYSIIW